MSRLLAVAALAWLVLVPAAQSLPLDLATPVAGPIVPDAPAVVPTAAPDDVDPRLVLEAKRESLRHLERLGVLPEGLLDDDAPMPDFRFRWSMPAGDLDGDGVDDLLTNEIHLITLATGVFARSGRDGAQLWTHPGGLALDWAGVTTETRGGDPLLPHHKGDVVPDLNGDGVSDVIVLYGDVPWIVQPPLAYVVPANAALLPTAIQYLSGADGSVFWTEPVPGAIAYGGAFVGAVATLINLPSFWSYFDGANGPRLLYASRTTTVVYAEEGFLTGFYVLSQQTDLQIRLIDPLTRTTLWTRWINASADPEWLSTTWLTGVADLRGGTDEEIVLDQLLVRRPQFQDGYVNPVTGDPLYREGRMVRVRALDGATGADAWTTVVYEQPAVRPNLPLEQPFQVFWATRALVLKDANGDGHADVMSLILTRDSTSPGTVNGQFRTHFIFLDGAGGELRWDREYTGWGYAASLSPAGGATNLIGFGTVDIPTPSTAQARFPFKEVHLGALRADDGVPQWDVSYRFGQDSNIVFGLGQIQYRAALAPADYDGDGVLDLVTPSLYVKPQGANQTLLATSTHRYEVLSGATGRVLRTIEAWGPYGLALPCGSDDTHLNVITGHSRRFDLSRLNVSSGTVEARRPIYFDERERPATAPVNLVFMGVACERGADQDVFSMNLLTRAIGRPFDGYETIPLTAVLETDTAVRWIDPALKVEPPLLPSLVDPGIPIAGAAWWSEPSVLLVPAGVLPGAAIGVGLRVAMRRRGGGLP